MKATHQSSLPTARVRRLDLFPQASSSISFGGSSSLNTVVIPSSSSTLKAYLQRFISADWLSQRVCMTCWSISRACVGMSKKLDAGGSCGKAGHWEEIVNLDALHERSRLQNPPRRYSRHRLLERRSRPRAGRTSATSTRQFQRTSPHTADICAHSG